MLQTVKSISQTQSRPFTLTVSELINDAEVRALLRRSLVIEPIDLLMAILTQAHGPAGIILKDSIMSIDNDLAKRSPVEYLRKLTPQGTGTSDLLIKDKLIESDDVNAIFEVAGKLAKERNKDKATSQIESIILLSALVSLTEERDFKDIKALSLPTNKIQEAIAKYLNDRQLRNRMLSRNE